MTKSNAKTATLQVPRAMLPALAHAVAIARNTAMCDSKHVAKEALEELYRGIAALCTDFSKAIDEHDWIEIGIAGETAEAWDVRLINPKWMRNSWMSCSKGHIEVEIDGTTWSSSNTDYTRDSEDFKLVEKMVGHLMRIEAERRSPEEV